MTKMNKKGFTLIEMLVVIAIIAVLVSIIVPTVSSATKKANYATDAANLRSALAECEIAYLSAGTTGAKTFVAGTDFTSFTPKSDAGDTVVISVDANGAWTATIGSCGINDLSTGASTGSLPAEPSGK